MDYIILPVLALAGLAVFVSGWLNWQLFRQNGRFLLRLEELEKRLDTLEFGEDDQPTGLAVGTEAPAFELPDLAGKRKSLAQFRGQPLLLIFFNPACGYCRELAPKLAALTRPADTLSHPLRHRDGAASPMGEERGEGVPLPLIVTTSDAEANRQIFAEHKVPGPVLLQRDGEVSKAYQANGTPTGYLIDAEGKIASELAIGAEALLALANGGPQPQSLSHPMGEGGQGPGEADRADRFRNRSLARSKIKRDGLRAGTVAPEFQLPRLDGRGELSLSELRGRRVLLVFSSPHCGPCNALAPQLEQFHREQRTRKDSSTPQLSPPGARESTSVEIVMISKGEPKENRAKIKEHGLTFPVVLQQQWEISRRYAMFATPIAYLIDGAGVITQDVAVGTDAILALIGRAEALFHGCIYVVD